MIRVSHLEIPDVLVLTLGRHPDTRGYFAELYSTKAHAEVGVRDTFVQDNLSMSSKTGTIRGLHFQAPPYSQAKLIRVSRGRILDVALDIRRASPTYGRHVAVEMSSENGIQMYIPHGFAHGFCTLEPDTEVVYKVSNHYAPQAEMGILWSDPDLQINWPVSVECATVSDKDVALPLLKNLSVPF